MKKSIYPFYHEDEITSMYEFINYIDNKYSDKIAFSYEIKKELIKKTYKEFRCDVIKLANIILKKNFVNEKIAILGENSYEWIVSYFAITSSKNIAVPIDKELSVDEVVNILNFTNAKMIICSNDYIDYAETISKRYANIEVMTIDSLKELIKHPIIETELNRFANIKVEPDDEAVVLFTSGTTGNPKGVVLTHKNITLDITTAMKFMVMKNLTIFSLPLHHAYGFGSALLAPLFAGCEVYINRSLKNLAKDIEKYKPTFLVTVPQIAETFYKQIIKTLKENHKLKQVKFLLAISSILRALGIDVRRKIFKGILAKLGGNLEMIVIGGAPMSLKCQKAIDDIGIKPIAGYGISECSPIIALNSCNFYKLGSAGVPITCAEVKIDKNDKEYAGEILAKGDMVMKGYFKNPELTKDVMDGEYFRTGDIGYIDKDGFIFITGRKKNLIILSNGKNVYPEELEAKLLSNDIISEVVVRAVNDTIEAEIFPNQEYIKNNQIENVKEVLDKLIIDFNKQMPLYKNVACIKIRDEEFPKTSTKKIKRY